MHKILIGGL